MSLLLAVAILTQAEPSFSPRKLACYRDGVATAINSLQPFIANDDLISPLFYRYIWCDDEQIKNLESVHASLVYTLNHGHIAPLIEVLPDGHTVRINLLDFAPTEDSFKLISNIWNKLIRRNQYLSAETYQVSDAKVAAYPFFHGEGDKKRRWKHRIAKTKTWRRFGVQFTEMDCEQLQLMSGTDVPIVTFNYLNRRLLSALSADDGLYYEVRGYPRAKKGSDQTDFDLFCDQKKILIEDLEAGGYAKWVGQWSGISPNPRTVMFLRHLGSRPVVNQGLFIMTMDVAEEDFHFDVSYDPLRAVPNPRYSASEGFYLRPDGMVDFVLFQADQSYFEGATESSTSFLLPKIGRGSNLQEEAPSNVVTDHSQTRNHPATHREIAGISCLRCHAKGGCFYHLPYEDSIQEVIRDFGVNYLPSSTEIMLEEFTNRVQAVFAADLDKFAFKRIIDKCKEDLTHAHNAISGLKEVSLVWDQISRYYDEFWYRAVTTDTMLREHGYTIDSKPDLAEEEKEELTLQQIQLFNTIVGTSPIEQPLIVIAKRGRKLHRAQWESIFPEVAERIYAWEKSRENPENLLNELDRTVDAL